MIRSLRFRLFAGLLTLVCGAAVASAQLTGPGGEPAPAPAPPAAAGGFLAEASIVAVLREISPDVRHSNTFANGAKEYEMKVRRDGWNYTIKVQVPTGGRVWILCHLGKAVSNGDTPPANVLFELMKVSDKMGPTYFSYEARPGGHILCLNNAVDRRLSAAQLKGEIDRFLNQIKESYPTWKQAVSK